MRELKIDMMMAVAYEKTANSQQTLIRAHTQATEILCRFCKENVQK